MPDEINIEGRFARLEHSLARNDEEGVQQAVFDLGDLKDDRQRVLDGVVERLLTLLRREQIQESPFAGKLLNFFEFESAILTDHQKWLTVVFLNEHGDKFVDLHSSLVVAELRRGQYLKMKKPNEQRWNDYLRMAKD